MPHSNDSTTAPFESRFPELNVPVEGWRSNIPEHLLKDCEPQMVWLLQEVSKNTQATNFACHGVTDISRHLRGLNGKVYKNEEKLGRAKEDLETLKEQAQAVSPFLKPISMFATLWSYSIFKWFFVGGIIFFLFVLYPYYLKTASASQLFNLFLGGGG